MITLVAVAIIVPYADGIVLGRRAIDPGRGAWSFPSGYVDRGEVVEEAACREVLEEVGLEIDIAGLVGVYSTAGEPVILVVFAARVVGGELTVGPEMSEVGIFSPEALPPITIATVYASMPARATAWAPTANGSVSAARSGERPLGTGRSIASCNTRYSPKPPGKRLEKPISSGPLGPIA